MESPNQPDNARLKRKRSPVGEDAAAQRPGPLAINYLAKTRSEKLRLMEGDAETFSDVLDIIEDYEGVLQRHESLAANLGAKLTGPLVLKSFEKLFDGPIKVIQTSFALEQSPASWLDIVTFARTNPTEVSLNHSAHGANTCRFWIKGGQVEISEDDYRLIMSGGPERMIPTQPILEDEAAELGTLNILESRLAMLIKKADAVASKARQLNYHLKGRKTAILGRKSDQLVSIPQPTPMPQPVSIPGTRSPNQVSGEAAIMQHRLLEQFLAGDQSQSTSPHHSRTKSARGSTESVGSHYAFNGAQNPDSRRLFTSDDGTEGHYRVLMAAKIEKLARGDSIFPPCDRCRRLGYECTKHLTACSACTKKHAKCSWKDIKEGELDYIPHIPPPNSQQQGPGENGYRDSFVDGQIDMGPRSIQGVPSRFAMPQSSGDTRIGLQNTDHLDADPRRDSLSDNHAILTQIASAAATGDQ
ncbi:uncharacterized protein BP5553_01050 [Venustampulla echinocandica]|uniref:Zn(2)-C6 fungal-type domain-containing protein n=1 Tax=Venustampulla echinocandica TaxID=2656787 RepID=A0A370TZW1_9HELO|nr:uncharacterized protein BP5553_01050 [Venustampulla echinocandica]RDL41071.1 hypothetical protein BP5553_01050 [Venustampulla echinocandica]